MIIEDTELGDIIYGLRERFLDEVVRYQWPFYLDFCKEDE